MALKEGQQLKPHTLRTYIRYTIGKFGNSDAKEIKDLLETEHGVLAFVEEVRSELFVIAKEDFADHKSPNRDRKRLKRGQAYLDEFLKSCGVTWD